MRTVLVLLRKEYLQLFRDRATLFQLLVIPVIQLLVLSNAASFEVRETPMHAVDLDRSGSSRELVARFAASGRFRLVERSASAARADRDLLDRRVSMVLHIPPDFEAGLVRRGAAPVQLVLNAEDGAAAGVVRAYATHILADYGADAGVELRPHTGSIRAAAGEQLPAPGVPRIEVRTRGWYNPALDYHAYMVPGILVALVTVVGTVITAQNIAREKEIGTIEQLNVTPITRGQFIAGKLLPFWIIALADLAAGLVLGRIVFDIPMRGSLVLVFGAAAIYLVAALGIGLLISTVAQTQQQAQFVAFFVLVVYLLMSGIFTPVDSMPRWAQWIAQVNPVKHFVVVMRAVLVKGAGIEAVRTPLLVLIAYAAAVLTLAVRRYGKRTV